MKRKIKYHKYFDCSINDISNQLHNKESFGPIENDIMYDLNQYSHLFGFKRTYNYKEADIFITNTIYPIDILEWSNKHSIPKIKRMDGIYWKNNLLYKNIPLNKSAKESDHVIFISEYSKNTLYDLYKLKLNNTVILNDANDEIFYPRKKSGFSLVSSCSNWDRDGKRLDDLINFGKSIDDEIHLIGKCDRKLPNNFIKHGYIDNQHEMSNVINDSNIFISLFFRDAGSKVTCQAIKCGLPVLYTTSGGLKEIVGGNGISVKDYEDMDFKTDTPRLNINEVILKYKELKDNYDSFIDNFEKRESYYYTIEKYFNVFKSFL